MLFARLTPGFRSPIFFTAGLSRMSPSRFFLADGIYALPGVTLLFFLGYWFSGTMVDLINNEMTQVKHILVVVLSWAWQVICSTDFCASPSSREIPRIFRS